MKIGKNLFHTKIILIISGNNDYLEMKDRFVLKHDVLSLLTLYRLIGCEFQHHHNEDRKTRK